MYALTMSWYLEVLIYFSALAMFYNDFLKNSNTTQTEITQDFNLWIAKCTIFIGIKIIY